jgi:hypothetical protein
MLHPARLKLMKALGQLEVLQKRMDEQTTAMADLRATLDKWEAARSRKAEDERLLAEYKETSVTPIEITKRRGIERERYLSSRD